MILQDVLQEEQGAGGSEAPVPWAFAQVLVFPGTEEQGGEAEEGPAQQADRGNTLPGPHHIQQVSKKSENLDIHFLQNMHRNYFHNFFEIVSVGHRFLWERAYFVL